MCTSPDEVRADPVAAEIGPSRLTDFSKRVSRYGQAKLNALNVANYMAKSIDSWRELGTPPPNSRDAKELRKASAELHGCGNYLSFRHYIKSDVTRLHAASLCRRHLLCQLCAIRRGAKTLQAYIDRWESVHRTSPSLTLQLVTLTVKDGPNLIERFNHLGKAQRELWKRTHRKRAETALGGVAGAVWSYEVKRGKNSREWHPHLHMIAASNTNVCKYLLSDEWKSITGDSHVVDVRPIRSVLPAVQMSERAKLLMDKWYEDELVGAFCEVFKYAVKFSDQPPSDTVHCWQMLGGRRLIGSAGVFRGIPEATELVDEPLNEEFISYFFRFIGSGYQLQPPPLTGADLQPSWPRRRTEQVARCYV